MPSVGEKLRQARLELGVGLEEVALRTKINSKFLAAIEADEKQLLPGVFFYRSWVQQYADSLSLDVTPELSEVIASEPPPALPGQDSPIRDIRPAPMNMSRSGDHRTFYSATLLVLMVVACSGVYAWWHNGKVQAYAPVTESVPAEKKPAENANVANPVPVSAPPAPVVEAAPESVKHAVVPVARPRPSARRIARHRRKPG